MAASMYHLKFDTKPPIDTDDIKVTPMKCAFYIKRKRRKCNLVANVSTGFCGEHSITSTDEEAKTIHRLQCPVDPRHTCWSHKLKKHLKVCEKQQRALENACPVYYQAGINAGEKGPEDDEEELAKITANTVDLEEVADVIQRVERLHGEYCQAVEDGCLLHASMREVVLEASQSGNKCLKHAQQEASILAHLQEAGLLTTEAVYVEFGVGNGHLTYRLARELGIAGTILAVDRQTVRHKFDRRKDFAEKDVVKRVKIDIEHLNLDGIPEISSDGKRPVIGYSKHLCGPATDLCLRCVCNTLHSEHNLPDNQRLRGLVIALCCHHKGNWRHYVGKQFFQDIGLTSRDYHIIQSLTSWATCAFLRKTRSVDVETPDQSTTIASSNGAWSPARREEIGLKCKRLLDAGRIHYLRQRRFLTRLIRYVEASVSRENVLMVVTPYTE